MDGVACEPKSSHKIGHFVGRERSTERIAKKLALIGSGIACVGGDKVLELRRIMRATQVTVEKEAARLAHADCFSEHGAGLGDVVDDAIADDNTIGAVGERKLLRVGEEQVDAASEADGINVLAGQSEHVFGRIDGGDVKMRRAAGEFDGDLGGASAEVEYTNSSVLGARRRSTAATRCSTPAMQGF